MCRKPEDAENLMDKMVEQRDLVKDMDSAVAEGLDEDLGDLDDMLADLDMDMAAEKTRDLPEAGSGEPVKEPAKSVPQSAKPAARSANTDLQAELDDLSPVCWDSLNRIRIHSRYRTP